ncbi:MAG: hypothetical protein SOW90_05085 [Gallibacter sp.]|nr:hypothetical protein [Gallibacter sp.]
MNKVLCVCLVVFSLFTCVSCNESENGSFQNEASEVSEKAVDATITDFKSSVSQNVQKIKKVALQSNYTRSNIYDDNVNVDLKESLKPVLEKSKDVLSVYGITEEDLAETFSNDVDALGIPAGLIVGSAKSLTKKAILEAAKKMATRSLGWVGAAIAVVDFASCMDYI